MSLTDVRQVAVSSLYLEVVRKPSLKGIDPFFCAFRVSVGSSFSRLASQLQYSFLLLIHLRLDAENKREPACSYNTPHSTMLTDEKVLLFGSLLLCSSILYRIRRVKQVWQAFENLPAHSILVSPLNILSRILPRIPWISDGRDFGWENVYERQPVPSTVFLSCSQFMSRRLRSFQLRFCSTPVTLSVQYPTTDTRRRHSC